MVMGIPMSFNYAAILNGGYFVFHLFKHNYSMGLTSAANIAAPFVQNANFCHS
jgi:hypothetical protein